MKKNEQPCEKGPKEKALMLNEEKKRKSKVRSRCFEKKSVEDYK